MTAALHRYVPALRRRDGDDCAICRMPIDFTLKVPHPKAVTVDHLVPRSLGGRTTLPNLRLAHNRCNNDRGAGWNSRRKKHAIPVAPSLLNEPGDIPVAVCWDDWSASRR
jgi:5-methylcytosine-specific restriction endonuclease McrA